MSDDFDCLSGAGLESYLAEFSDLGSYPTSLGGYGVSEDRYQAELGALAAQQFAPVEKPSEYGRSPFGTSQEAKPQRVSEIRYYLTALGAEAGKGAVYDTAFQRGWDQYVKVFREPSGKIAVATKDGIRDGKIVWINSKAFETLKAKGRLALAKGGNTAQAAKQTAKKAGAAPAPAAGSTVINTSEAQNVLKRLGWTDSALKNDFGAKPGALDDNTFGPTTQKAWAQSSRKRKLDGTIAKATADGTQVRVVESTYLQLRAIADANAPTSVPQPVGGSLKSLPVDQVSTITLAQLQTLLQKLVPQGSSDSLDVMYGKLAKARGLDGRLEAAQDNKNILVLKATWDALQKEAAALSPQKSEPKPQEKRPSAPKPPAGFTKVSSSEIIGRINDLSISEKMFNRNGDRVELADAIRTFLENTKTPAPAGDIVWGNDKTGLYVRDTVIKTLASAMKAAQERATATAQYTAGIVDRALKESSATIGIRELQMAIEEAVFADKVGGSNKSLYKKVRVTGGFDSDTQAAYTDMARGLTIGPSILEAERRFKEHMGPRFNPKVVEELRNRVWGEFLKKAVSSVPRGVVYDGQIKTLPVIAKNVAAGAKAYERRLGTAKAQQEVLAAQQKMLTDVIKRSTRIVSILSVQQAVLLLAQRKEAKSISGLKVTGYADAATADALFELSGSIFPKGSHILDGTWKSFLTETGLVVRSELDVKKGWVSGQTNYIALPASAADLILKQAGEFILRNGMSKVQVVVFSKADVVQVPRKPSASEPVAKTDKKKAKPRPKDKKRPKQKAERVAATKPPAGGAPAAGSAASSGQAAGGYAQTGASAGGAGGQAAGGAGGQAAGGRGGDVSINIQAPTYQQPAAERVTFTEDEGSRVPVQAPGTEPPAPPEPVTASAAGGNWLLWSLAGVAALVLANRDDKKKLKDGAKNTRSQYTRP
jgi:hypothetical protein